MVPSLWVACPARRAQYRSYKLQVTPWARVKHPRGFCEYVTGNGRYVGQRPGTCVDSGSCGPQATWTRALQGAPHL
eukprot:1723665-Prymnesium_polylepis.1